MTRKEGICDDIVNWKDDKEEDNNSSKEIHEKYDLDRLIEAIPTYDGQEELKTKDDIAMNNEYITKEEEKKNETINTTNNYNSLITYIHHNNLENENPFCNA